MDDLKHGSAPEPNIVTSAMAGWHTAQLNAPLQLALKSVW